jgi:Bacterial protein of unknown function (DUF885)
MKFTFRVFILVIASFTITSLIAQSKDISILYKQTSEMADLMIQYNEDKSSIMRCYSTTISAFDEWSSSYQDGYNTPERRKRLLEHIKVYQDQMEKVSFAAMNIYAKVDYVLFKRNLQDDEYQLQLENKMQEKIEKFLPFSNSIYDIEKPRRRGLAVNGEQVAKTLNDINKEIKKSILKLKDFDSIDKKQVVAITDNINGIQLVLKNYYSFYNGYDPLFTWWVPKTYAATDSLLALYSNTVKKKQKLTTFQKDDGSGIIGNPIGEAELIRQLKQEFIAYSPTELIEIANKEFAWCDAELLKASNEMGFGNNWKAAQEKVKNSFVAPGKQPEAMYDLYNQSVNFLKSNDLLTIPPLAEETWRMYMMAPERQLINPFFLGGEALIVSYPTNTMSYEEKLMSMRGNNPRFSRATIHHELIAGHHLQFYMNSRYKSYRHFGTPFWVEGNALYWEMLLWDLKFPQSPEDRIGMLFWRMHRCARIIFSLNYHLSKWTPQQCIDFLVDRVGHERANAEGEVRRSFTSGYSPLYQIAYMIGGLQFMSLKKELVDTKKMTLKQYHDAILQENQMPIELLRATLINQSLSKDFKTNWRFYGN